MAVVTADTTPITIDPKVCGTHVPSAVEATPDGLADVIVWIADAKTGKALPIDASRRAVERRCVLDPRVQATVSGSTVNVFNDDKALHKLVFLDAGTGDTMQRMPFFNNGQVVASEKLAKKAGIVEVRCAQHPWTRAYIATFDHPYFAVTEKDGKFTIDSLPPGKYTVNVWHEGDEAAADAAGAGRCERFGEVGSRGEDSIAAALVRLPRVWIVGQLLRNGSLGSMGSADKAFVVDPSDPEDPRDQGFLKAVQLDSAR